jgi:TP901 family phage tail tape measure protein
VGLGKIFSDKDLISDPAKFNPAVTAMLRDTLGGSDAKSLKSIAGAAGRYRNSSVNSVDANAMIKDLLPKLANNLPLANMLFGAKQGGRIATALGDSETLQKIIGEIDGGSEGYAGKIAGERMAGFDGAVSRFEGAVKNLETAVGRSFDKDGKGGALTWVTDAVAKAIQSAAEESPNAVTGGAGIAGAAGLSHPAMAPSSSCSCLPPAAA